MKAKFCTLVILVVFLASCKKQKDCEESDNNCQSTTLPFAHYKFDGDSKDASGNALHGSVIGGVSLTTDRKGNPNSAYWFNGVDGHIEIPHNNLFNTCNFTFAAWIRPDSFRNFNNSIATHNEYSGVFSKLDPNIAVQDGITTIASSNYVRMQVKKSDLTYLDQGDKQANLVTNQWRHIVYVYEDGLCSIYLDGQLQTQGGKINPGMKIKWTNSPAQIGLTYWFPSRNLMKSYFSGAIDDVRLYNRAISSSEAMALATD